MKKVLIATPCLDGKVDAWFVNSLYESTKLGLQNDVMFQPVFLANESILQMARNELLNLAYQQGYDDLVFIDDDEEWKAEVLLEIVQSSKDVVAVPVVNKGDKKVEYNPNILDKDLTIITNVYYKRKLIGFVTNGCLCISSL